MVELRENGKLVEAQRLEARTLYDIEMLEEVGYCSGIENYARYLSGRKPGERPLTLMDFFPSDFLCVIDESHVTLPQIGAFLAENDLHLIGFELDASVAGRYRGRYPGDVTMTDLTCWDAFERDFPATFSGMYQFWAQKNA